MKKLQLILCVAIIGCYTSHAHAQKHSFTPQSNTIKLIGISELEIIGYDGKEIAITNNNYHEHENSDRAKGLKLINSDGLTDNTGIGLSLKNEADGVKLSKISSNSCENESFTMKVPAVSNIYFEHVSWSGEDLKIKNISGEVNISSNYNDVYISGVSGPIAVKTVYGAVEVVLDKLSNKGAISLYSIYEYVDLSIPATSNANVNMSTTYGNIYSDIDIMVKDKNKGKNKYFGETVDGSINGGGQDIILNSTYDDIYLRRKK